MFNLQTPITLLANSVLFYDIVTYMDYHLQLLQIEYIYIKFSSQWKRIIYVFAGVLALSQDAKPLEDGFRLPINDHFGHVVLCYVITIILISKFCIVWKPTGSSTFCLVVLATKIVLIMESPNYTRFGYKARIIVYFRFIHFIIIIPFCFFQS